MSFSRCHLGGLRGLCDARRLGAPLEHVQHGQACVLVRHRHPRICPLAACPHARRASEGAHKAELPLPRERARGGVLLDRPSCALSLVAGAVVVAIVVVIVEERAVAEGLVLPLLLLQSLPLRAQLGRLRVPRDDGRADESWEGWYAEMGGTDRAGTESSVTAGRVE